MLYTAMQAGIIGFIFGTCCTLAGPDEMKATVAVIKGPIGHRYTYESII